MLSEEFQDIPESSNEFMKALYKLDYSMGFNQLANELIKTQIEELQLKLKLALIHQRKQQLSQNLLPLLESPCTTFLLNGQIFTAVVDKDMGSVEILETTVWEGCNGSL
ncbi:MAG: hypothetical protein [Caudoviricetes sp.]|nr:MAG: hypothetical protein [Caudoviricetes sp.]